MRVFLILLLAGFCFNNIAQERFDVKELDNPKSFGKKIASGIDTKEVFEYSRNSLKNTFLLENDLRSSTYINATAWDSIKDLVEPQKISIIFSKYPIRKHGYRMNYPLLFNRLKNLFKIDELLNDSSIQFEIILQTNCINDLQVDSLFHGISIHYKVEEISTDSTPSKQTRIPNAHSAAQLLEQIENFNDLPEQLKNDLEGANEIQKTEALVDYFEESRKKKERTPKDSVFLSEKKVLIDQFIRTYSHSEDSIVYKVFDRNPNWKDALVIADWTGSMYQYGAQALLWHTLNYEKSGLTYFTLFNDGNKRKTKKVGSTGGIYFEKADNIEKVIELYQLVMLKGSGGDSPENDLEAIIEGIENYPIHSNVILIADNNACVRDMSLLELIKIPVKVILCGVNKFQGINPQYLEIAKKTNGSLHTIELDIYNLDVNLSNSGRPKSLLDYNIKIGSPPCYDKNGFYSKDFVEETPFNSLDSALLQKNHVLNLNLSDKGYTKTPRGLKKFKHLKALNLNNNNIRTINKAIYSLNLESLELSYNKIQEIPFRMGKLSNLKRLNLSHNSIDTLPNLIYPNLRYIVQLDLSYNNIANISRSFNYKHLEFLYLDNNELTSLSSSVSKSRKLIELTLSNNKIAELPRGIGLLKKLKVLDISNNELKSLPSSIFKLKNLDRLILNGNDLENELILELKERLPNTVIEYQ